MKTAAALVVAAAAAGGAAARRTLSSEAGALKPAQPSTRPSSSVTWRGEQAQRGGAGSRAAGAEQGQTAKTARRRQAAAWRGQRRGPGGGSHLHFSLTTN